MVHAQEPTCTDLRIRSTQDTHKIFYAVQKGLLKMVTRRLDADERLSLRSGCVYAWEERGPHSEITGLGIERFTEGRRWTPSRVRDEFLFYYERYMPPPDANNAGSPADTKPPRDWEPLVKQTYSVWVDTENGRRKWHLTAYFTQGTIDQLRSVDDLPGIGDLVVPEGHFKSTRVGKNRSKQDDSKGESSKSSVTRTFAAFPPYPAASPAVENQPVLMYEPYQNSVAHTGFYHPQSPSQEGQSSRQSHSPQSHSSASLSPPMESSRVHYPSQPQHFSPSTHGDAKSRMGEATVPSHSMHSHPSEYRALAPVEEPTPMVPLDNHSHGQRGKPVRIPSYAESRGLNDDVVNVNAFGGSTSDTLGPSWNTSPPTSYVFQMCPTPGPSSMQGMNDPAPTMGSSYVYSMPQSHPQHTYSPSPSHIPQHHYDSGMMNVPLLPASSSDTPRTLPPLQLTTEDPLYIPNNFSPPPGFPINSMSAPVPNSRPDDSRALAPLYTLNRPHPYKRNDLDDKALRLLQNGSSTSPPP